jgi:hypothetical protein
MKPTFVNSSERKTVPFCPCGKSNGDGKFNPYSGYADKGYCHSCGKTFAPEQDKSYHRVRTSYQQSKPYKPIQRHYSPTKIDTIPHELYIKSFDAMKNNFLYFIAKHFGMEKAKELQAMYHIGSSNHWQGATVFWYIDAQKRIRSGKIMLYHADTGKRVKEPRSHVAWVHTALKSFTYSACLFGEHLITPNDNRSIAIVESEKTAIIASVYFPQTVWLASGSKGNIKEELLAPCKRRPIVFYPDNDGYEAWCKHAKALRKSGFDISINDFLKNNATSEEEEKDDLADYLLKHVPYQQSEPTPEQVQEADKMEANEEAKQGKDTHLAEVMHLAGFVEDVSTMQTDKIPQTYRYADRMALAEIERLEKFFADRVDALPSELRMSSSEIIADLPKFIQSHLITAKGQGEAYTETGDHDFRWTPYLWRLQAIESVLCSTNKLT